MVGGIEFHKHIFYFVNVLINNIKMGYLIYIRYLNIYIFFILAFQIRFVNLLQICDMLKISFEKAILFLRKGI